MGIADAWLVLRFELRRYRRWRPLRRWLAAAVLTGGVLSAVAFLMHTEANPSNRVMRELSWSGWYTLPALMGCAAVMGLTSRLVGDRSRYGTIDDLYLTELHPLGSVVGKVLAAWVLAWVFVVAMLPFSAQAAAVVGITPLQWLCDVACGVIVLPVVSALIARLQWRVVPLHTPKRLRPLELTPFSATLWALLLWVIYLTLYTLGTVPIAQPLLHLLSLFLPFGAMLMASALWEVGSWQVPMVLVIIISALGWAIVLCVATAQWLGWWSQRGYKFQRIFGSGLYLGLVALTSGMVAQATPTASTEPIYYNGLLLSGLMGYWIAHLALGLYGVGTHIRDGWGVVMRKWLLLWATAATLWGTLAWGVGKPVPLGYAVSVAFYFWSLLVWVQVFSLSTIIRQMAMPNPREPSVSTERIKLELYFGSHASMVFAFFTAYVYLLLLQVRTWFLPLYYLGLATPLGGLLSARFPAWVYLVYGVYVFGIAGYIVYWETREGYRASSR